METAVKIPPLEPIDWSPLRPADLEAHIAELRETRPDLFDGRGDWVEGIQPPQTLTNDSRQPRDEPPYRFDEPEPIL